MLVALPFPLKYSIDAALAAAGGESTAPTGIGSDPGTALLIAAGALAALIALQAGFRALSVSTLNRMGGRVATDLRGQLLDHLHRLSPGRDIDDLGRTTSPLVADVARLRDLVSNTGPRLLHRTAGPGLPAGDDARRRTDRRRDRAGHRRAVRPGRTGLPVPGSADGRRPPRPTRPSSRRPPTSCWPPPAPSSPTGSRSAPRTASPSSASAPAAPAPPPGPAGPSAASSPS